MARKLKAQLRMAGVNFQTSEDCFENATWFFRHFDGSSSNATYDISMTHYFTKVLVEVLPTHTSTLDHGISRPIPHKDTLFNDVILRYCYTRVCVYISLKGFD